MWTIKKIIDWSTGYLNDKGIESPRLETELLLAHTLGVRRLDLYLQFDRPLTDDELAHFKSLLKRRTAHEPLAYITGKREFWSRDFFVTKDVLIPRPETELLVELVAGGEGADSIKKISGLEIGLGSGIISITLLCEIKNLQMTAIEISPAAIEIAAKNAEQQGVSDRLKIIKNNFLTSDQQPATSDHFDFIVSNPPYVKTADLVTLAATVKNHEPHLALDGGNDGLIFYRKLAEFATTGLKEQGLLAVEIGEDQGNEVSEIFQAAGLKNIAVKKDLAGHDRVVTAIHG